MEEISRLFNYDNNIEISGLTEELNSLYVASKYQKSDSNIIVLTSTLYQANKVFGKLSNYLKNVALFPMDDFAISVAVAVSPDLKVKRLETLERIKSERCIIVTNLMGYLRYLPGKEEKLTTSFNLNEVIKRSDLIELLEKYGYEKTSIVTQTGEYAIRGYIVDIYPINADHPIRIEMYGDNIDSIRYFDESTQISIEQVKDYILKPFTEMVCDSKSSLFDLGNNPIVCYFDYEQIKAANKKLKKEIEDYNIKENKSLKYMFDFEEINPQYYIYLNTIKSSINKGINYNSTKIDSFNSNIELLTKYVNNKLLKNKTIVFCVTKKANIERLKELFPKAIITKSIIDNNINIISREITESYEIEKYVVISEYDIDNSSFNKVHYQNKLKIGKKIKGFDDIKVGDYVVHAIYGIGIYNGLISIPKNGIYGDYIQLIYKGNDKIYVPAEKIDTLYKYSSKEGSAPVLNKLGTGAWEKTKRSIQKKLKDITDDLIKLYSARSEINGPVFEDNVEMDLFKEEFQYEETIDQTKAISDILSDLSIKKPMDRLLCGDVGFGKTEVAFRAAFKTVINGFQVAYLCPTTILSNQHYQNAIKRFKNYPINIALLNRFTSTKNATKIINDLKEGKIDIIIGTHKLLNSKIEYKQLGLLVVDEEQRFGVMHKESIKQIKNNVNVLTLSATPIPRTLKFALSGLRDLSLIDTAPVNRYPVQTYVLGENDFLAKEAIYNELSRGGQSFIVYNNIDGIEHKMYELKKLIPDAKFEIAHGQMSKEQLEDIMQRFISNDFDVLMCTTIIETGIDIPNVNTLIIYDADRFGLSQLYQLRGRVGRSDKIAYAYLFYNENKMLNDSAVKRLQAIKEFTELGSGYKIAMRDLSIRGAGDLLGSEQAGFVDAVGMDLYMKMLDDAIHGNNEEDDITPNLVDVTTHINDDYVSDEDIKIEIHKLINSIDSKESYQNVKTELIDRFGDISEEIEDYMYEEWFEKLAKKWSLKKISQNDKEIVFEIPKEQTATIKGDKLFLLANNITTNYRLQYKSERIYITLLTKGLKKHFVRYLVKLFSQM